MKVELKKYDHKATEAKWQKVWNSKALYSPQIGEAEADKFFNLWMFPYPSGEGLHAGHAFASTGSDVFGRYMRMQGKSVFQPIGYDSFGIHAENFAIKVGDHPQKMLDRTTKNYERQLKSLGHGYDWTRTVTTSDPSYYKWTQWLFIQMFKAGLAYKKKAFVNWCPGCKTVLADEQIMTPAQAGKLPPGYEKIEDVPEGVRVCERCGNIPEKRELSQWFFKITDYADRLLANLDTITWSERVKVAQREWIGRKEGVIVSHKVKDLDITLDSFSAYPAWLFADTFLVIAPEHPIINELVKGTKHESEVLEFVKAQGKFLTTEEKAKREKAGIFTGRYAIDPLTKRKFPIWLANFALMDFGTGVIRCSAHDPRDYEFAQKYDIPLVEVVERTSASEPVNAHTNRGMLKDSGEFTGREINDQLINDVLDWISKNEYGKRTTTYHLRDWLISRQRYWGPPIPMIECEKCGWQPVPEEDLPVVLPQIDDYKPKGEGAGPLADHPEFYETTCPNCGGKAKRETDVSDTFLDSAWYFLRYPSVDAKSASSKPFDAEITKKWLPVDLYFGGAEHSVLHLMYARFIWMALKDLGYFEFSSEGRPASGWEEPFPKFFAHGLMIKDGAKMSKSRGNVVNPDEYIEKYGADTLRLYLMFMGPMDGYPDFRDTGIEGMSRFVQKVYQLLATGDKISVGQDRLQELNVRVNKTIQKVTEDIKEYRYNTSISSIMELVNLMKELASSANPGKPEKDWLSALTSLTKLLAPFAPHLTEEIWERLGNKDSVHTAPWPTFDAKATIDSVVTVAVQVNGKLRANLVLSKADSDNKDEVEKQARENENVAKWIQNKEAKVVFVPGRIINFVV